MLKDKLTITYNLDEVADLLQDGIKFLKSHDIDSAEVRTIDGKNIAKLTLEETKVLKETLAENGLSVSAIASPLFKWYADDVKSNSDTDLFGMSPFLSREGKEEMIRKIIEQACILDTKKIRIFSGLKPDSGDHTLPQEESNLIRYALDVAKQKGVQLMLENEPVCYISKLEDYIGVFVSGEYEGLRAWFDIANVYEEGESINLTILKKLVPFISYLHIKDPISAGVHEFTTLGNGCIDYDNIFTLLDQVIIEPLLVSIETHVKEDKYKASHESLIFLHELLEH